MDGSKCILQLRGVRPFLSDKFDITKHKNYRYLSDSNPKNAFDIGKFVSTRLKVAPDEEYVFFEYVPADEEMPKEVFGDYQAQNEAVNEFNVSNKTDDYDDFEEYQEDLEPI